MQDCKSSTAGAIISSEDYGNNDGSKIITITSGMRGDNFPAAEVFAEDKNGNKIFLNVAPTPYGPNDGPGYALFGDNKREMGTINTTKILIGENDVFIGVIVGDKVINPKDWNKSFENTPTECEEE